MGYSGNTRCSLWLVVVVAALSGGCVDSAKQAKPFLEALKRGDYDAANANLHPKARAHTPNAAAIKAAFADAGIELATVKWACSSDNTSWIHVDYTFTPRSGAAPRRPVIVGAPGKLGRCNPAMWIDMEKDGGA